MDAIVNEKQRRIQNSERDIDKPYQRKRKSDKISNDGSGKQIDDNSSGGKVAKSTANLSSLVKSVKAKTQVHANKQQKGASGLSSKKKR